jgi:hypothetical protein
MSCACRQWRTRQGIGGNHPSYTTENFSQHGSLLDAHRAAALHLVVEDLGLAALCRGNQVLVQNIEDIFADTAQLGLDFLAVFLDECDLALVAFGLLLLLNGGNNSPGRAAGTNDVLVGDRKKISLLDREFLISGGDCLHVLHHFCADISVCPAIEWLTEYSPS